MKGLNTTSSSNRVRFSNLSQRLQRVNVDVIHRVHAHGSLNIHQSSAPSTGSLGCHFQDELEQCKSLDTSSQFKRFYYSIWPLVQSLPELIHHQEQIVTMLETNVREASADNLSSFLQLISVLGRDLEDDLYPHFHRLFGLLVKHVDNVVYTGIGGAPNPELTGRLFECMSYLIKYQLRQLGHEANSMRKYYGPLLGHPASFVRDYSAKTFSVLMRKLKPGSKIFRSQNKYILKAVATNVLNCTPDAHGTIALMIFPECEKGQTQTTSSSSSNESMEDVDMSNGGELVLSKRVDNLLDGLAGLYFSTCKGVRGCLHSQGGARLTSVMDTILPAALRGDDNTDSIDVSQEDCWITFTTTQVLSRSLVKLFRHQHPSNFTELWIRIVAVTERTIQACRRYDASTAFVSTTISNAKDVLECAMLFCTEVLLFGLSHSKGRGLSDAAVKKSIESQLVTACMDLCEIGFVVSHNTPSSSSSSVKSSKKDKGHTTTKTKALLTDNTSSDQDWRTDRLLLRLRLLVCYLRTEHYLKHHLTISRIPF